MDDHQKIQEWAAHVEASNRAVTTADFYLRNAAQFLQYFSETPPRHSRLSAVQVVAMRRTLKKVLADLRKKVVLRQVEVKAAKMDRIIFAKNMLRCREVARHSRLSAVQDPTTPNRNRFYGYLVAFVVALYGHRPGVLVMTTMNECSVCGRVYTAMSYHLVTRHLVINTEERAILLNLASGRTPIRSDPCPAVGCAYHSSQLDKHLKGHSELTPAQRARLLKSAKERKSLRLLADLRATNPSVPMATALDLAQEEGQVGEAPQPQQEAPGEEEDVGEETWALSQEVRSVRAKVATLTRALASARRWGRLQSLHLRRATGPPSLPPLMAGQGRRKALGLRG
ncbi:uncharacterized protein LOC125286159 [Alosa alosa]|uniref:uncharacterized protein LOC125286159 n=1 Tax=Alosa alosa TaxID=278164 RepID=UPI00201522D6|nr:uncharacterized protein LOC125286159 [Alosa alosa]